MKPLWGVKEAKPYRCVPSRPFVLVLQADAARAAHCIVGRHADAVRAEHKRDDFRVSGGNVLWPAAQFFIWDSRTPWVDPGDYAPAHP